MADLRAKIEEQIRSTHVLMYCKTTCSFCSKVGLLGGRGGGGGGGGGRHLWLAIMGWWTACACVCEGRERGGRGEGRGGVHGAGDGWLTNQNS